MKPEGIANWYWFCVSGALAVAKLCKFRPSDPFSPRQSRKVWCWVRDRLSRLGDPVLELSDLLLAQARDARLGEVVMKLRVLSATSRPGEEFMDFERIMVSLRREMTSPKRDVLVMCGVMLVF